MIFFKLPFDQTIYTVDHNSENRAVSFHSFDEKTRIDFKGEIKKICIDDFLKAPFSTNLIETNHVTDFLAESENEYCEKLESVIEKISELQLSKLVISRIKPLVYRHISENPINLSQSFLNLCESYPNAFSYIFYKNETCWMGAFSELLGKFDKKTKTFETMSLAGTLPVDKQWTSKEIEEQKPVSNYIFEILNRFSNDVLVSETYDHISGNIKHLRTDFTAKISQENLEKIITELHPTPAVCGIPKEFCKQTIKSFEKHSRKLYSGYIRIATEECVRYYVNLRCAEFMNDSAFLYVGGGITAQSNPRKEWEETELKSQAILKNLQFI